MNEYKNIEDDPDYQRILKLGEEIEALEKAHDAFMRAVHEINAWVGYTGVACDEYL